MTSDDFVWTCSIDGVDETDNVELIAWKNSPSNVNAKLIKFANDQNYLNKYLDVTCVFNGITTSKRLDLKSAW